MESNKIKFRIKDTMIGDNKILIQSMSTYLPSETRKCIKELKKLEDAGADILRVAIKSTKDALAIPKLKKYIKVPLVGDIHYNYDLGIKAIENGIDKIRFNPGNIGSDINLQKLLKSCIEHDIPVRIGVNSGSIEKDYDERTDLSRVDKCVLSLKKYVSKAEEFGLKKIVLSIKLSDCEENIEAYKKVVKEFNYPLHVGLTESGIGMDAIVKSIVSITTLLKEGIGDTIRVSLTGDPIQEVIVAKSILKTIGLRNTPNLISCPTCGRCMVNLSKYANELSNYLDKFEGKLDVACMGCAVNGLGEARDADIGIAFLKKQACLFIKGQKIKIDKPNVIMKELKIKIKEMLS